MIRITFTAEEQERLNFERFHHPDPAVRRKMEVLYLKSCDLSHGQIARLAGTCENTVRAYFRQYLEGGIERLKENHRYRPRSALADHREALEKLFREHPPATVAEAAERIAKQTGIRRQPTQVRHFLNQLGMKPRKVASVPAKQDVEKQMDFKKTSWIPS